MNDQPAISFTQESTSKSENPHPWLSERTKAHSNSLLRFHNQLIQFSQYVKPLKEEHQLKMIIFNKIEQEMKKIVPEAILMSPLFTNKLYLKQTQLELFLVVPKLKFQHVQNIISGLEGYKNVKMYQYLDQKKAEDFKIIFVDPETEIEIWLILVDESWKLFISECDQMLVASPEIRYLTFINLCMVRQRGFHHMIKSIFIFGMCAYFLFERRKQRVRTLTEHFLKFLEFFGGGTISQKRVIYKGKNVFESTMLADQRLFSFEIAPGVDLSVNILKDYLKLLQNRYRVMGNYSYEPGTSIVTHLVNPSEEEFNYL